jgi:hypothetical protein
MPEPQPTYVSLNTRCRGCTFCGYDADGEAQCRVGPPQLDGDARWPRVDPLTDFCGLHTPRN